MSTAPATRYDAPIEGIGRNDFISSETSVRFQRMPLEGNADAAARTTVRNHAHLFAAMMAATRLVLSRIFTPREPVRQEPGRAIPFWRSITGRLFAAVGMMFVGLVVTNVQTISFSRHVSEGSRTLAAQVIDGERARDAFDERLDQHRRIVMTAIDAHSEFETKIAATRLAEIEQALADNAVSPGALASPSTSFSPVFASHIEMLARLAREALSAALSPEADPARALALYIDRINLVEEDLATWKASMRELAAVELSQMSAEAQSMLEWDVAMMFTGCGLGLLAVFISQGVLRRLRGLTTAMLSLSAGDLATDVPFRGGRDEIGRLAAALEVFRDNAGRVAASEADMTAVIENMAESIVVFSPDQHIVLVNQKFADLMGLSKPDCVGWSVADMVHRLVRRHSWPSDLGHELSDRLAAIRGRTADIKPFEINPPTGESYTVTAAILPNENLLLCVEDVSERRASAARIFYLAHHDTLTDLPNRALFQERLDAAVEDAASEQGLGVTLLLCDLDRFKDVNDTYGHPVGDELLRQVAHRIRDSMRRTDLLARLGGDEFAIIHLSGTDPSEAHALAARIVDALKQPFEISNNQMSVGISIGIASAPTDAKGAINLMKRADLALYAAKHGGRNMFMAYDEAMAEKLEQRRTIEIEMRKALDAELFHLNYQPQVNLHSRRITGFEALARWNHPELGPIPPSVFIPIAEQSSLIVELGEWVLRKAWRSRGVATPPLP
jgi:diguanylate cyclase (GGDEF)-like protein